jgi:hypothetical protein
MALGFVNRELELRELDAAARRGGLLVVYGRRRVGKTRLLRHWLSSRAGRYSQAIEAPAELQVRQTFEDVRAGWEAPIAPRSWQEFLDLAARRKGRWILCLDEFPYLAASDPSLPSRLQRWLDHEIPPGLLLVLAGSSTSLMHRLFLGRASPLFGRASKLLPVRPMDYAAFCRACSRAPGDLDSFETYSCVGGIPKYWEFVEPGRDALGAAEALYFDDAPYMEQEPQRILKDEGVAGLNALAVLETVGRGAARPSEIASRLGMVQTNLSRLFQQLLDASILERELPYGESVRSTRKSLYRIQDPTLRFWFRVYSPHRSLWRTRDAAWKRKLIHDHASTVFEDHCRARFPGSRRHWEAGLEIDLVAPDPARDGRLVVAEVKFRRLSARERDGVLRDLESRWARCSLRAKHPRVRFEVLDASILRA